MDIISIYNEYLESLNAKKIEDRYKGKEKWFHSSDAGGCYKKLQYSIKGTEYSKLDDRVVRNLHTGDLLHESIQDAVLNQFAKYNNPPAGRNNITNGNILRLYQSIMQMSVEKELEIQLPKLNVRGFLDLAVFYTNKTEIYEIKTVHAYKWKKKFGRNPEESNGMYEMQVATHGLCLKKQYSIPIETNIVWFKRDDGSMRIERVNFDKYSKKATEYWQNALKMVKEELEPGIDIGVPFLSWECNWCRYKDTCKSPLIKEKKR